MIERQYEELFEMVTSEISSEKLRLEVYDHVCSCIEFLMDQGADFDSAKRKAQQFDLVIGYYVLVHLLKLDLLGHQACYGAGYAE